VDSCARHPPQPDGCELDKGKAIDGELLAARRGPTASLGPIEEPLDPVTGDARP